MNNQAATPKHNLVSKAVAGSLMLLIALTSTSSVYAVEGVVNAQPVLGSVAVQKSASGEENVASFCGPTRYCPPVNIRPIRIRPHIRVSVNETNINQSEGVELAARGAKSICRHPMCRTVV